MRRACRAIPPDALCCVVYNRLEVPFCIRDEGFAYSQQTTAVCWGGGLNKYQARAADRQ